MNKYYILLFVLCVVFGCGNAEKSNENIKVINFKETFNNNRKVNLSEICDSLYYIKLETNEKCLLGDIRNILRIKDNMQLTVELPCISSRSF